MQISAEIQAGLEQSLESEFKSFRTENRPGARIPEHLRQLIFSALAAGLQPSLVRRICGVGHGQLVSWQRCAKSKLTPMAATRPRVLNVIPEAAPPRLPSGLRVTYESGRLQLEVSF